MTDRDRNKPHSNPVDGFAEGTVKQINVKDRRVGEGFDHTYCWCAKCYGQGLVGHVTTQGDFECMLPKTPCNLCGCRGRCWVDTNDAISIKSCANRIMIDLLSPENSLDL